jgi:hypothetical protein
MSTMHELWVHCRCWSEEKEQAFCDKWALRIISCPRRECRRRRLCSRSKSCPSLLVYPFTNEEQQERITFMHAVIKQALVEAESEDQDAVRAVNEWRNKNDKRRQQLAPERAKAFAEAKRNG